jgi:hypothetical protein
MSIQSVQGVSISGRSFSVLTRLLASGMVGLSLLGCPAEKIQGEGAQKLEERNLSAFESVEVNQSYDVRIEVGKPQKVTVEADESLLPLIQTEVTNNTLKIANKEGKLFASQMPLKVTVSLPRLQKLRAKGASLLTLIGVSGPSLAVELDGGHQLRITGGVLEQLKIDASGASQIETLMLQSQDVDINMSGAASARIRAEKKLKVSASGASKLEYNGNPQITQNINRMSVLRKL